VEARRTIAEAARVTRHGRSSVTKAKVLRERGNRVALHDSLAGTDRDFAQQLADFPKLRAKASELQMLARWAGLDYELVELLRQRSAD